MYISENRHTREHKIRSMSYTQQGIGMHNIPDGIHHQHFNVSELNKGIPAKVSIENLAIFKNDLQYYA